MLNTLQRAMNNDPMISLSGVTKVYSASDTAVKALDGVDLCVARGDFVAIVGRSGCGKSTLLNLLGGLDNATSGTLHVDGRDISKLTGKELTNYRRRRIGIVFQFFNLLPLLTVLENVMLPALLAGDDRSKSEARAKSLLGTVGLSERLHQGASLLSGGEMQRVAMARALINDPPLLLADEPTGNLDSHSATQVLDTLAGIARDEGKTVMMVTHSREAAAGASRLCEMRDGRFI